MDNVEGKEFTGWNVFSNMLTDRFIKPEGQNLIGDFNKLQQDGTLEEYKEKFKEHKSFMSHSYKALNEEYYLKSFISGLEEEFQDLVIVQRPMTISQAFTIAKLQESMVEKMKASSRTSRESYQNPQSLIAIKPAPVEPVSKVTLLDNSAAITKKLSNEEVKDWEKRGLCFHCDEKYTFGHKCKKVLKKVFLVQTNYQIMRI